MVSHRCDVNQLIPGLVGEEKSLDTEELVSPVRDRILTKFAKLAPSAATSSSSNVERLSRSPSQEGESWLGQVRGRLSVRQEGGQAANTQGVLPDGAGAVLEDLPDMSKDMGEGLGDNLNTSSRRLSHSRSEATLLENSSEVRICLVILHPIQILIKSDRA